MDSKRLRVSATTENVDRISDLPDALLIHILSFMPTVCSVRTRVLSTRWKHLFSLVPFLHFFRPPQSYSSDRTRRYLDFVNWVFNSYNVDRMDRFFYRFCTGKEFLPECSRLLSWISDSVRRGVRELDITDFFHEPQTLPRGVFTCERLTVLKIRANFNLDIPEDVCLPCLRKIYLMCVSFVDGVSAGRLFRSCPMLEDLSLWNCDMGGTQVLELSVPTLKCLKMHRGYKDKYDLVLDAPNVEYFEYTGKGAHRFHAVQGLKLLAKASISFYMCSYKGSKALKKLVSVVCHVRHISFCAFTLQAFQKSAPPLPVFRNLIHLEINKMLHFDSRLVLSILDRIPHLEVLVVDNGWFSDEEYNELFQPSYLLLEDVPACVSLHLKEVEFRRFSMLEQEFQLVEYFLKNAKILETVMIRSISSLEKLYEVNKKLLILPRCSRACRIVV